MVKYKYDFPDNFDKHKSFTGEEIKGTNLDRMGLDFLDLIVIQNTNGTDGYPD